MCGIVGYVGKKPMAREVLLAGLTILENRGYDSAGLATLSPSDTIDVTKFASLGVSDALAQLAAASQVHNGRSIGIAHTRWATHGGKTDENAHPHTDMKKRVALVHNGVIENAGDIRRELEAKGIVFESETDTESIAQLLGSYLDEGLAMREALQKTIERLRGTWGLAVMHAGEPTHLYVARNGSPIVIGVGKEQMFIASEPTAFAQYTKDYIALKDGEIVIVDALAADVNLERIETMPEEDIPTTPDPYPHWTIKEIFEQPEAMSRALNHGGRFADDLNVKLGGLDAQEETLLTIKHLVIAACGTSFHAGLYASQLMRDLHAFETVQVIDASELTDAHFAPQGAGLLVISQSGETKDVHRALVRAQEKGIPAFSVVNRVRSLIARSTNCGVYLNAGYEHAVASTKAFTTQVTVLSLIAIWFAQHKENGVQMRRTLIEELHRLPTLARQALRTEEACKALAEELKDCTDLFVLGKGDAMSIAYEGALKIKEITYIHAEGYPGGALKHGPFALIAEETPIILTIFDDEHGHLMRTAAQEVRARGAKVIVITDRADFVRDIADTVLEIPNNGRFTALLAVLPLQLIAYHVAVLRGYNPDKPRNLAKAVTVD
jgi:glucosamine--fructose-6-phosphate aminotransferase (isomerizing)